MPFSFLGTGAIVDKPLGAILHFNGNVYCGAENSGTAKGYIYNPSLNTFTTFTLPATDYYPRVLLLDGRMLFCGIANTRSWLLVNEDGTYQTLNDWNFMVNGASLMRDGRVAICNATVNRLSVFNPKTTFVENFPNVPSVINGIAPRSTTLLPDGKIFLITGNATYPAWIFNPFNNIWEQIALNGFTSSNDNQGSLLYDGGLVISSNSQGLNLVNIYSKKIIDVEAMTSPTVKFIRICPDGDVFLINGTQINKYNITNSVISNVGYTTIPATQNNVTGAVMLPSGNMFLCSHGAALNNNGFTIWDSSLGTLPDEVCLSAFYNRG